MTEPDYVAQLAAEVRANLNELKEAWMSGASARIVLVSLAVAIDPCALAGRDPGTVTDAELGTIIRRGKSIAVQPEVGDGEVYPCPNCGQELGQVIGRHGTEVLCAPGVQWEKNRARGHCRYCGQVVYW